MPQGFDAKLSMKSALYQKLDEDQRERTKRYLFDRIKRLEQERETSQWWAKRQRYEAIAADDYSERKQKGIFQFSNENFPACKMVERYLTARLSRDLFGSEPWLLARPEGPTDGNLADRMQKHFNWKLRCADYVGTTRPGVKRAVQLGELILKTTWDVQVNVYEREATILRDKRTNQPVTDARGDYLYAEDEREIFVDPRTGAEVEAFVKAPEIVLGPEYEWRDELIEESERLYSGLRFDAIYYKDFLAPMNAKRIAVEEADFVAHRYDVRLKALGQRFNGDGEDKEFAEVYERLATSSTMAKAEGDKGREVTGEPTVDVVDEDNPPIQVTECYFRFDPFGDGRERRIMAVVAEEEEEVLDLRYLAEVSPRSEYPIHVITINGEVDRWTGAGIYELYDRVAEKIDALINSILYRNSYNSDPIKIYDPSKLAGNPKTLEVAPGKTYQKTQTGIPTRDVLDFVVLPDLDERTYQLFQLMLQAVQVDSGVTNANQGDISSLPSNTTATGINSMLEASSVLHLSWTNRTIRRILSGATEAELAEGDDVWSEAVRRGAKVGCSPDMAMQTVSEILRSQTLQKRGTVPAASASAKSTEKTEEFKTFAECVEEAKKLGIIKPAERAEKSKSFTECVEQAKTLGMKGGDLCRVVMRDAGMSRATFYRHLSVYKANLKREGSVG